MSRLFAALGCGVTLLLLAGCEGQQHADRTIVVEISHSRFEPAALRVAAGETVRFIVRNEDPIGHEFLIGDEELQQVHEKGTEGEHGERPGEISVGARSSGETIYTFDEPGRLIFGCHLPQHYDYGMRGVIDIT